MTDIMTDFEAGFRPTYDQIIYAKTYLAEAGLESCFVSVNFPGKQRELWIDRQAVMDGNFPAIWVDKDSALAALDTGAFGNAMFRVRADGEAHLVDEV